MNHLPFFGMYWSKFVAWLKAKKKPHCCNDDHQVAQKAA